jgi:hypothetical protein
VTLDAGPVTVGASTENDWWGPGVRNALLLSNNAEGVPHALARTRRPLRTRLGDVEARWQLGVLSPSLFTDSAPARRWRAMSAASASLRPARAPNVTIGVARAVVTAIPSRAGAAGHVVDALLRWDGTPSDSARAPRSDAYGSLFARWIIPRAHAEVYGERARRGLPRSFRELLVAPHADGAITLGLQAIRPLASPRSYVRVQLEASSVEQSIAFGDRPTPAPFYAGLATRDGYTYRGQVMGAAIGPGGSSQWIATDLVRGRAEGGLFVGRIRWNNDALYSQPNATFFRHDVSTFLGARGAWRAPGADVAVEGYWARRYNYLFQNGFANPGGRRTVDVTNVTASLSVTPR